MKIARAPYRISLFGGSTDYESYYSQYGSLLLGFTINAFAYVCMRRIPSIFENKYIIRHSHVEKVNTLDEIKHSGFRGTLKFFNEKDIEINFLGDLPARTGIGSSSSCIVATLYAINTLLGKQPTKKELATDAIYIERELLKEPGGIQDQIWASYGGMNSIEIKKNGDFFVKPLPVSEEFKQNLKSHLLLFYTGEQRQSFDLAQSHDTVQTISFKHEIRLLAEEALEAFTSENIFKIGYLLHKSWLAKKGISKDITSDKIDILYESALRCGAIGGKLLGSGTSGFMVFVVLDKQKQFIENMQKHGLICVDYNFDNNGTEIIL